NQIPQNNLSPDQASFPVAPAPVNTLPVSDIPDDLDLPEHPQAPEIPAPSPAPETPSSSDIEPSAQPAASAPTTAAAPTQPAEAIRQSFTQIPVELIRPNPWQPRKVFKEEQLKELSDSIREHGVLQPLVVIPLDGGYYQLIVGERRLRASQMAGLEKVPVIIRDAMEEQKKLELALIENIQRHNLDPIEEAMAYQQLIDNYRLTQEEVAKKVGKGRTTVTNMLRLLHLPLKIQRAVAEDVITEGHARAILGLIGMEKQLALFDMIVAENLTVRQVEDKVREIMERPKQVKAPRGNTDPEVVALESELRGKLGTKVKVQKRGDSGRIMIEFYSREELNSLLDKIGRGVI
ncbi:MAG: ParB/RepB/Spo0J family partition protein, partial [Candidatus Saccharibacteria bacterium]